MKRLSIIFALMAVVIAWTACEKDEKVTLDLDEANAPVLTSMDDMVLLQDDAENEITFQWSAAQYPLENLPDVRYSLQLDLDGNDFAERVQLVETSETSFTRTVAQFNQRLTAMELEPGVPTIVELRVVASITAATDTDNLISNVMRFQVTIYEDFVIIDPIYMLGDGTAAGWNNTQAIEMYPVFNEDGSHNPAVYTLIATLGEGGNMVKFISVLGQWAPQWGSDGTGTAEEGILAYRPTEDEPDPDPINISELDAGDYRVTADTTNLTYTITKATEELYLLGSGTEAGWDNTAALAMTKDGPGMFSIVTTLTAGDDMFFKFIEVLGQWAPQYGTWDEDPNWEEGNLAFRPTEAQPDPESIPTPPNTGTYLIEVNLSNLTYKLTAQ
jgi:starch-binding outer membrane protein SusE/F